jgi:hypothetical protein
VEPGGSRGRWADPAAVARVAASGGHHPPIVRPGEGRVGLTPPPPLPPHTHPPPPATLPVLSRSFRLPPSCRCPARARSRTRSPDHSRVARSGRPSARASCSAAHAQPFAFRRVWCGAL